MNIEQGLENLESILKGAGLAPDSEEYLDFQGWRRNLRASIENERRYGVLSPQEQERRERVLRELDRLALRYAGQSFLDVQTKADTKASHSPLAISEHVAGAKSPLLSAIALLIGVGDYTHPEFADLPATIHDTQAIAAILTDAARCGYPSDKVQTTTGPDATLSNIRAALQSLAQSSTSQSTVFLYFSGHGGRALENGTWRAYLCPRDADPDDLAHTAISGDEFSAALTAIPAQKMLVVLDSCHSGGAAELKGADGRTVWKAGLSDDYYEALSQGAGRVIIASSKEDQFSWVRGNLSLFSQHLVQALSGEAAIRGDGLIHVLDVFHHVSEAVRADEPRQVPILKVKDLDLNFPIALALGGKAVGSPVVSTPVAQIREHIIKDPTAGAKALSDYLGTNPEWAAKRDEVDLKRADLKRILHDLELFGPNDNDKAAKNRIVFFLLHACLELENREQ